MKHAPPTPPFIPLNSLPQSTPEPRPMSDQDWENYVQQKLDEEADFFNATAPLAETFNV